MTVDLTVERWDGFPEFGGHLGNVGFKGIVPLWLAMLVAIATLIVVPDISLLLPNTMFG